MAAAAFKHQLGLRIRKAREERGLSQAAVAQACHVDEMTVSRWERGVRSPTVEMLKRLVQALGVGYGTLLE